MIRLRLGMRTRTFAVVTALLAWVLGGVVWSLRLSQLSAHHRRRAAAEDDKSRAAIAEARKVEEWLEHLKAGADDGLLRADQSPPTPTRIRWLDRSSLEAQAAAEDVMLAARLRRKAAYHAWLARKYRDAASRPWLPVAADAPEPR